MGNTADLAMVQKTIIDTLHKEGKSQRVITERGAVQGVLYQSIVNAKLTGMKMCTSNMDDRKLENTSCKADSNPWKSFTRSELKLESVHQESPRSDIFRKRATKPLLKQKHHQKHLTWDKEKKNWTVAQWSKVLFSDESTFCISFVNQGPRVWRKRGETQNPCCLKSRVKFPQTVMIWAAMSSAGVDPLCFIKSTANTAIYQDILEHFSFLLLTSFMKMMISFSSRTSAPAHTAKTTSKCFADHDITVLDRPANMPDLNPIRYLWDIFKRKMRNSGSNNTDDQKAVPQADRFHATPHWCWSLC